MALSNHASQKYNNLFISDDPEIRVKLAHLALAFGNALVSGDLELAHRIRGEAILLRLVGDIDTSDIQTRRGG